MLNSKKYEYLIDNSNYEKILNKIKIRRNSGREFKFTYSKDFKYKDEFIKIEKALNIKDKYYKYSYIYDKED